MRIPRHLFGLPLHPMLVHFPLAFWLCVPVLDAAAILLQTAPWWNIALGATGAGVVIGAFALITGLLDYVYLSDTGSNDVRLAARHGVRTAVVWCVMTGKLICVSLLDDSEGLIITCLVVDVLACGLLLQGAYFGTKITYGGYRR